MRPLRELAWWFLMLALVCVGGLYAESTGLRNISIVVDRSAKDGVSFLVDGKAIAFGDLLGEVSRLIPERGPEAEVLILAKKDVAIVDLLHVRSVCDKAGLSRIRFFLYDPDRKLMSEMTIDFLGIPFTLQPPPRRRN